MKKGIFPKLAWEGIRKNKRLYFPYILTGCMMVSMFYVLSFLIESPALGNMKGGSVLMTILPLGCIVIAVFSVLFLFYTNSFLLKQRYREFGLYNILGMDKKNIGRIMVWESLFVAVLAIGIGMFMGMVLSKGAELVLLNLLSMDVTYSLNIGRKALLLTPAVYGVIYVLLMLNSLIRVGCSRPLELMFRSRTGERIPKRTWLFAVAGVILLAMAYYLAVAIQEPLSAMLWFFIAVVFVMIGTYLLFIAGSVVFCRLLQKNKRYYYQPSHFVSVSSMVYRMKRNGAGLASICILLTMVLVMISSTTCLYFGAEDSLRKRCPQDVNITLTFDEVEGIGAENLTFLREQFSICSGAEADLTGMRACEIPGLITEEGIIIDYNHNISAVASYDNIGYLSVISLEDYNNQMGVEQTLAEEECFVFCDRLDFRWETFTMEYGKTYRVKEQLTKFQVSGDTLAMMMPTVYLVVEDIDSFIEPVQN